MKNYTATIIGAGSIGALKPESKDKKDKRTVPLTHGHACWAHKRIDLVSIFDEDHRKAKEAGEKWDCGWSSIVTSEADIMIVAVPTKFHLEVVKHCADMKPKLIICEKPFGMDLNEAMWMHGYCEAAGVPLMVDYSRRFEAFHQGVYEKLSKPGVEIYNARVIYGRGLKHDGSHAIDLCNWWFGALEGAAPKHTPIYDRDGDDPTLTTDFVYGRCPYVVFTGVDGRKAYTFEIDVISSVGRFQFYQYGTRLATYPIENESIYGSYPQLGMPKTQATNMGWNLHFMLENAVKYLDGSEDLKCDAEDAIAVHKVLEG